jgi:hypothetical protein
MKPESWYKVTMFLSVVVIIINVPNIDLLTYVLSACMMMSVVGMYHFLGLKIIEELRVTEVQRDTYYAEIRALRKKLKVKA